jgi:3-oxoacyl-[acyl-carrier protein] reductase
MDKAAAVVWGAARNIGLAISRRLLKGGFRVITVGIVPPDDPVLQAYAAFAEIAGRHPDGVVVNNVGIVHPSLFDDVAFDDFGRILHLNTRTCLIAAKTFVPGMRTSHGERIVMTTSRSYPEKSRRKCGADRVSGNLSHARNQAPDNG